MNEDEKKDSTHSLSFAEIIILRDDIAEVIVHEGIEMTLEMVHTYHNWLLNNLTAPFSILINKKFSYTYDFQAQLNLAILPQIHAMAVVSYSKTTESCTKVLVSVPREIEWNIQFFYNRADAFRWLENEQTQIKTCNNHESENI